MTLASFEKREGGWNRWVYLCEQGCDLRSLVDVPAHLDLGSRRREEVDYPEAPPEFAGEPRASDLENPGDGVFVADPPEDLE